VAASNVQVGSYRVEADVEVEDVATGDGG